MLSEVPYELSTDAHSKECKRSPQQSIPAGFPPHDNLHPGMEDSASPLTAPDMVRSGRVLLTSVKFPSHTKLSGIKTGDILPGLIPLNLFKYQLYQISNKYTNTTTLAHIQHISNAFGCAERPRQGPPPHLTRETLSGRRPVDGAGTPGGVFRPGENLPGEGDTADIFRRRRRE